MIKEIKIHPKPQGFGSFINWNITKPEVMADLTNVRKSYYNAGLIPRVGGTFGYDWSRYDKDRIKYIKQNKQRILDKWKEIFQNNGIPEPYKGIVEELIGQLRYSAHGQPYTFTEFTNDSGNISSTIKNRIIKLAKENGDNITQFHYAIGYIRHVSDRSIFAPFNDLKILFGDGNKGIYNIYHWERSVDQSVKPWQAPHFTPITMNEIKIYPNNRNISVDGNKFIKNKQIINKSTHENSKITKYTWDEALANNIFPRSGITLKNVKGIFIDKLGITPSNVYTEKSVGMLNSIYVKANYHGEPILYSRRETHNSYAGQTILYSKRARVQCAGWGSDPNVTKETILQTLKIPYDLSEIMIFPNNKATMDKFENGGVETAPSPVIAPPKPGVKPETPPKRRKFGNPDVDPRPKNLKEQGNSDVMNKIIQRFKQLKNAA
jgi:hypothetical protein